eukprot:TRINITY_DN22490_c0_g1_i1.p1 TRINITY_DN22490_c0_g1~~TRINITY_DN22490_c0_g1_i1.p1  ORF type:complete len:674 (-),score=128.47 TRINITY_DN22490_c0_g1_i1:1566-3488(-)
MDQITSHVPQNQCANFAGFTQFSMFGSLSWYFVESVNVYFTVKNPFVRPHTRNPWYHLWVWSGSAITAIILSFTNQAEFRAGLQFCYTKSVPGSVNWWNWGLLYVWIIIYWLITLFSGVYSVGKLSQSNMEKTLSTRLETIRRGIWSLSCFTVVWAVALSLWATSFFTNSANHPNDGLLVTLSFLLNMNGFLDCVVWIATHWSNYRDFLCCENEEKKNMGMESSRALLRRESVTVKDVSSALRKEFIQTIVESIRISLIVYAKPEFSEVNIDVRPSHDVSSTSRFSVTPMRDKASVERKEDIDNEEEKQAERLVNERASEIPDDVDKVFELKSGKGRFVEFFPKSFADLRSHAFDTPADLYIKSFPPNCEQLEERFSEGASGSLFFFTADMRFIVKTISSSELRALKSIFVGYFKHMLRYRFDSLVTRFYGLYSIELYSSIQYLVVMENIFWNKHSVPVHIRYDLKGSWVDRWADNPNPLKSVMKDNDLHSTFLMNPERAKKLLCHAFIDADFLCSHGIMDYSLLVGVHQCSQAPSARHCESSKPKPNLSLSSQSLDEVKSEEKDFVPNIEEEEEEKYSKVFFRDFHNGTQVNVIKGDRSLMQISCAPMELWITVFLLESTNARKHHQQDIVKVRSQSPT